MKRILFALLATTLLIPLPQISQAQETPECLYADSDSDGDGFGWENRGSCVVTEQSTSAAPTGCIDDDGDGWGWNGTEVCRVDVAECFDSDPIGDGWGWNGSTSCEVPAYPAAFSELEVLRTQNRTLFGASVAAATLICVWQDDFQVFDLFEDGNVIYSIGIGNDSARGIWTTGFTDSDGIVHVYLLPNSDNSTVRHRILMQPGSVTLQGNRPSLNSDNCIWAV